MLSVWITGSSRTLLLQKTSRQVFTHFNRLLTNLEKDLMGGIYNVDFFFDLKVFITGKLSINLLSSRHWLQF